MEEEPTCSHMQISFIESLLQLYKNWTKKTGYLQNRQVVHEYDAGMLCWLEGKRSEEVHHAEVSTEEELADYKRERTKRH